VTFPHPGVLVAAILGVCCVPAYGADRGEAGRDDPIITYKITPSYYHVSDGNHATDLNLRANLDEHVAWFGYYQDRNDARQMRLGYENTQETAFGHLTLSVQSASHGFVGGSAIEEIGGDTFAILGLGADQSARLLQPQLRSQCRHHLRHRD
jgi:hypothetical protein